MKKRLAILIALVMQGSLDCSPAIAQTLQNFAFFGNSSSHLAPLSIAPHLLVQPVIFQLGNYSTIQLNGELALGGIYSNINNADHPSALGEVLVSSKVRHTSSQGWTFGAALTVSGETVFTYDFADPFSVKVSTDKIQAYAFVESPTLDVALGRFSQEGIAINGNATLNGVIDSTEAHFSANAGHNPAVSLSSHQGPWKFLAASDFFNRQYGGITWRRPVGTFTPSVGVEVMRDGNFNLASVPILDGMKSEKGELYGGRAGVMIDYGRVTFGASSGLEAFYDGTKLIDTQSIYDLGISNKSGRFVYGVSSQLRHSHTRHVSSTSVTTDMVIAISTGVNLELGYQFWRLEDEALADPIHSHVGKADIRLSF